MNSPIEIPAVTAEVDGRLLLDLPALQLSPGKITVLAGPSGSGKTTYLNRINGLTGARLTNERIRIGRTLQSFPLLPWRRVYEVLQLAVAIAGGDSVSTEMINTLEIHDLLHSYPETLSGGERARVALGFALSSNPHLLLLDEPFTGLDFVLQPKIGELVARVTRDRNLCTLMVSHDPFVISALADRAIFLNGTPSRVAYDLRPRGEGLTPEYLRGLSFSLSGGAA